VFCIPVPRGGAQWGGKIVAVHLSETLDPHVRDGIARLIMNFFDKQNGCSARGASTRPFFCCARSHTHARACMHCAVFRGSLRVHGVQQRAEHHHESHRSHQRAAC
jgi:hypothetical protein